MMLVNATTLHSVYHNPSYDESECDAEEKIMLKQGLVNYTWPRRGRLILTFW